MAARGHATEKSRYAVFSHAQAALETNTESDKLNIIRDIRNSGNAVKYYILRNGLSEDMAYEVESVMIDFLSYDGFKEVAKIANIVAGHHQWDRGIKTVEEIVEIFEPLNAQIKAEDNALAIKINATYPIFKKEPDGIYCAVRSCWRLNKVRIENIKYVLAIYNEVVRGIFIPKKWVKIENKDDRYCKNEIKDIGRWRFEKKEDGELEPAEKEAFEEFKKRVLNRKLDINWGQGQSVRYIDKNIGYANI